MKSVLIHVNPDSGQNARLQVAADIIRTFTGHLTCLRAMRLETFAALDPYSVGNIMTEALSIIREAEHNEKQAFEDRLRSENLTWNWLDEAGDPASLIVRHSALADLVVMSRPPNSWQVRKEPPPAIANVVTYSKAPILVVPDSSRGFDCAGPVAIAWNGSPEACAAIKAALPLLKRAQAVHLVTVEEESRYDLPPTEGATYLSRHGVKCELVELANNTASITDLLLEAARLRKASCLVMGAYSRSPLRESILGGVTRGMLQKADIPLLLAH